MSEMQVWHDQVWALVKAARYKVGEERTRADGSVWRKEHPDKPPVMVRGPDATPAARPTPRQKDSTSKWPLHEKLAKQMEEVVNRYHSHFTLRAKAVRGRDGWRLDVMGQTPFRSWKRVTSVRIGTDDPFAGVPSDIERHIYGALLNAQWDGLDWDRNGAGPGRVAGLQKMRQVFRQPWRAPRQPADGGVAAPVHAPAPTELTTELERLVGTVAVIDGGVKKIDARTYQAYRDVVRNAHARSGGDPAEFDDMLRRGRLEVIDEKDGYQGRHNPIITFIVHDT